MKALLKLIGYCLGIILFLAASFPMILGPLLAIYRLLNGEHGE